MIPEQLREYLTFYRDLGVKEIYRRQAPPKMEIIPLAPPDDSLAKIRAEYGDARYDGGHFKDAVELFMRMVKNEQFDEFLSLPAYELLP